MLLRLQIKTIQRQVLAITLLALNASLLIGQDSKQAIVQRKSLTDIPEEIDFDEQEVIEPIKDIKPPEPIKSSKSKTGSSKSNQASSKVVKEELPSMKDFDRVQHLVEFEDVPMSEAMKLFAEQTGVNIITSSEAGKCKVSVYLKNVSTRSALEAIVKANGLFYRIDDASHIVRIATTEEYEKDLASFREEETRVFTLLYPNPLAVAQVIQQVFGNRVQFNAANSDFSDLVDLSQRFSRFDIVDGRALGLGTFDSNGRAGAASGNGALGGMGRNQMLGGFQGNNGTGLPFGQGQFQNNNVGNPLTNRSRNQNGIQGMTSPDGIPLSDLSSEEIQRYENQIASEGQVSEEDRSRLLQRKSATIYVSTIRRNNQIIVRTGDPRSMEQIEQLVQQLDVPTPTVLLEVKVMRIVLTDGFNSAFEYFGSSAEGDGAFTDGAIPRPFPGGNGGTRTLPNGLGVAGKVPGALTFQIVDDNFNFRMQLLQSKSRVTALATPLILTANNEVSRIFVGDTLPFTVGFSPSQVLSGINAVNGAVSATPVTELRDVGQSLLITPNINADRTVTLRVVEENSERVLGGASIPVPAADGKAVNSISVDTVRRRTVSGTVVAQDGMAVALGGLIEEQMNDTRDQIPVLGDIPGVGFLFRRQATNRQRSELVVVIRPYVFNTPSESAASSNHLLEELSLHPHQTESTGTMNTFLPCEVIRPDPECCQRASLFKLHNVTPAVY